MAAASNGAIPKYSSKESISGAAGEDLSESDSSVGKDISINMSPRSAKSYGATGRKLSASSVKKGPGFSEQQAIVKANAKATGKKKVDKFRMNDIYVCDMCNEYKVMEARCLNCESSLCGPCLDHHQKMKISQDHEVYDWADYKPDIPPSPRPPPLTKAQKNCKIHPEEELQFYCKVCMKPLCINCKLTKHEGHRTTDLWEEVKEQREMLPMKLSQIRASFLPVLKQQLNEMEDYEKEIAFNVRTTIETIDKRAKYIKEEIDRTSNIMVNKLKLKQLKEIARTDERRKTLTSYVQSATTALTTGERIVQSGNDIEVMELYQTLIEMFRQIQELIKRKPGKTRYLFHDGKMDNRAMETLFGSYAEKGPHLQRTEPFISRHKSKSRSLPSLQLIPEIHPRLLKEFKCKMVPGNKVSAIATVNDTEAWICFGWTTNEIYLYNKDGYRVNRVLFKNPVDDIASIMDLNGTSVVVSSFAGSTIRLLDRKLQVKEFFKAPLRCRGVGVSTLGDIYICGVDMCTALPQPTKSCVFKYTAKGNKAASFEGDKSKKIPCHPYRVAVNIDGSLAVSDWLDDKKGRVVIFGHDGKVRMVYHGQHTSGENFLPYGIAADKFGHVLVGDISEGQVHLLDIKGHFLRILLTKEMLDGEKPYSLDVDTMGTLWVGNERATIKIFRYYMHASHIVSPWEPQEKTHWSESFMARHQVRQAISEVYRPVKWRWKKDRTSDRM